jgi:antitoxin ParD1/3/4
MKQVQVLLSDDLNEFVETSVASGQYASDSHMISEALLLLVAQQSDEAKLKWLQEAYRIGIESGDAGELDFEAIKAEGRARLRQRAAE